MLQYGLHGVGPNYKVKHESKLIYTKSSDRGISVGKFNQIWRIFLTSKLLKNDVHTTTKTYFILGYFKLVKIFGRRGSLTAYIQQNSVFR